jgi:hypothetical protein
MGRTLLIALVAASFLVACGGSDDEPPPPPPPTEWVKIDSVTTTAASARIAGTAWVSKSWAGYRCVGLLCSNTDDFPGVKVTWFNETARTGGDATSSYGGGTNYLHLWSATVPLAPGTNVIFIHANDPSGRGTSVRTEVVAATPS